MTTVELIWDPEGQIPFTYKKQQEQKKEREQDF